MNLQNLSLIVLTSLLTATGNLLLRKSVTNTALLAGSVEQTLWNLLHLLRDTTFVLGVVSYIIATFMWLVVLSKQPIGLSYPVFVTCAFLFVTIGATLGLGETLSVHRLIGIALMLAGIVYVSVVQ